jgi:DNA-binding IclR family transcriptional regulator
LLGIQNGLYAQQIHIVETTQSLGYRPPNGTLRPLLSSVVGRVLLSQQSKSQVLKVVERSNAAENGETHRFEGPKVLEELAQIRRDGYCYSTSVFTPGVANVAVPLPVREDDPPMVVTVAGPSSRINRAAIPMLLQQIHAAIDAMRTSNPQRSSDKLTSQD